MGFSLVYALTLISFVVVALKAGALIQLLILLAISVIATLGLAMMKFGEHALWLSLIVPPALLVISLALTSIFDRVARRAWHLGI